MNNICESAINNLDKQSEKFIKMFSIILDKININYDEINKFYELNKKLDYIFTIFCENTKVNLTYDINGQTKMIFYKQDILICEIRYFYVSIVSDNYWYWFWSIDYNKNNIYKVQQLLNYGLNIQLTSAQNMIIRSLLINNKIKINDNNILLLLKALSMYLTKTDYIISRSSTDTDTKNTYRTYLLLYDILINNEIIPESEFINI